MNCIINNFRSNMLHSIMKPVGRFGLAASCALLILVAGCGQTPLAANDGDIEQQRVEEQEPLPLPEPEQIEPEKVYAFRYPLTGLGSDLEATDRPVMVMVENSPAARPQTGLDHADIVYEILAEGDITRFVAVYQSELPGVIGPVRSIRPYFVEIGDGLDAVIVHAGWSQDAMNILVKRNLPHLDQVYGDDAYYWRDNSRKAPHNLYTSIEKIRMGAEKKKFRKEWKGPVLTFAPEDQTVTAGNPANKVTIYYIQGYHVAYQYDAETGIYSRYMEDEPHMDKESGVQLTGTNILVCEAAHRIIDKVGRRSVDVLGPGKGYLVQQGKIQEVTWQFKDGIIRPYIDDKEVSLLPGKTWIHVVPKGSKLKVE